MYDYFLEKYLMGWFANPTRPSPPLYKRRKGSTTQAACPTPCGNVTPHAEVVQLTDEQVSIWNNT